MSSDFVYVYDHLPSPARICLWLMCEVTSRLEWLLDSPLSLMTDVIAQKGLTNVTVDGLVQEITPKARGRENLG